jgi:hypothetical protein
MAAANATLPVHLRHGMQWQTVSYTDEPTWRYLMAPHRQVPVRSGGDVVADVVMMFRVLLRWYDVLLPQQCGSIADFCEDGSDLMDGTNGMAVHELGTRWGLSISVKDRS